jgi:hypothetical protein
MEVNQSKSVYSTLLALLQLIATCNCKVAIVIFVYWAQGSLLYDRNSLAVKTTQIFAKT